MRQLGQFVGYDGDRYVGMCNVKTGGLGLMDPAWWREKFRLLQACYMAWAMTGASHPQPLERKENPCSWNTQEASHWWLRGEAPGGKVQKKSSDEA